MAKMVRPQSLTVGIQIELPRDLHRQIMRDKYDQGRNLSDLVVDALRKHYADAKTVQSEKIEK